MEEEYDIRVAEMKCGKCGNEVVPGKLYCPVCGHEIQVVSDSGILEDDMLEELLETSGKQDKKIEGSSDKKSRTATEKTKSKENSLSFGNQYAVYWWLWRQKSEKGRGSGFFRNQFGL